MNCPLCGKQIDDAPAPFTMPENHLSRVLPWCVCGLLVLAVIAILLHRAVNG